MYEMKQSLLEKVKQVRVIRKVKNKPYNIEDIELAVAYFNGEIEDRQLKLFFKKNIWSIKSKWITALKRAILDGAVSINILAKRNDDGTSAA